MFRLPNWIDCINNFYSKLRVLAKQWNTQNWIIVELECKEWLEMKTKSWIYFNANCFGSKLNFWFEAKNLTAATANKLTHKNWHKWSIQEKFCTTSVETFPRIFLLLLVNHDPNDNAGHASQNTQQEEEEHFNTRHRWRFGIFDMITGRLEKLRRRCDLWSVFSFITFWGIKLVKLHWNDFVLVRQVPCNFNWNVLFQNCQISL